MRLLARRTTYWEVINFPALCDSPFRASDYFKLPPKLYVLSLTVSILKELTFISNSVSFSSFLFFTLSFFTNPFLNFFVHSIFYFTFFFFNYILHSSPFYCLSFLHVFLSSYDVSERWNVGCNRMMQCVSTVLYTLKSKMEGCKTTPKKKRVKGTPVHEILFSSKRYVTLIFPSLHPINL
jgi:hypothetical protein